MISSRAIAEAHLDAQSLRARFDPPGDGTVGVAEKRLIARWRARAQMGRDFNLSQHRLYGAIDRAWDVGYRQTAQTIIGMIRDLSDMGQDADALQTAERWGMSHLMVAEKDMKTGYETGKTLLNLPVMYGVNVSLARATLMMRISRILNERLSVPLMKFEPAYMSDENRLRCDISTQRIETGNREFGYAQTFCEAVQGAAMYGQQLQLITEEWYHEMDVTDQGPRVGKEGLRYTMPHPSRSSWDLDWPAWTFNNDCGVRYVTYWRITTFGNVRGQPGWWNLGRISRSDRFADPKWQAFFQTTGQCRMASSYASDWFSTLDRERRIDRGTAFYSASEDDQPIWITEHFEKFNPRTEFDDPTMPDADIWFRIVLASDDTPLYVTALVDRPGVMWLYEPIGNRAIQQGLMLELMPFQDHANNLFTQGILAAEQSLANVTMYDQDAIDPADVKRDLENPGKRLYRKLNFWGFSGRKLLRQQTSVDALFKSYRFPELNIGMHMSLLNQLYDLMNRVTGMSAQEVGSSASHEQSAEEIRAIHTATSHRFEYVASWVDATFEAWKRQIYSFFSQYSTGDAYAFLSADNFDRVKAAGFTFTQDSVGGISVRVPMAALRLEHFVAQRDGPNRIPWTTIGGQMLTFLQGFMASPTAQQLPAEDTIRLVNECLDALQFPKSFRIRQPGTAGTQIAPIMQAFVQTQIKGLADQVKQFVEQKAQESEQATGQAEKQTAEQMMAAIQKLKQYMDQKIAATEADVNQKIAETTAAPGQVVIHQNTGVGASSAS